MQVDCGTGAYLLFSSQDNVVGSAVVNALNVFVSSDGVISLPCSSVIDVTTSANVAYLVQLDPASMLSKNTLLGLAGLICGAFVAYVMVKYAV